MNTSLIKVAAGFLIAWILVFLFLLTGLERVYSYGAEGPWAISGQMHRGISRVMVFPFLVLGDPEAARDVKVDVPPEEGFPYAAAGATGWVLLVGGLGMVLQIALQRRRPEQ
ncbi:hypothetical protein KQI84_17625 [bacterium]|nr:hypothetical protein [bacterium]